MNNKNIVLGIFIPLFFILISSNVLGNVYVGDADGFLRARGYNAENLWIQDYGYGNIIHEIYMTDEDFIFVKYGINSITSANKTASSGTDNRNWIVSGNALAYHTRLYTGSGNTIRERDFDSNILETFETNSISVIQSMETYEDFLFIRNGNDLEVFEDNEYVRTINLNFTGSATPTIRSFYVYDDNIYVLKRRQFSGSDNKLRIFDFEGNYNTTIVLDFVGGTPSPRTIKVKDDTIYIGTDDGYLVKYHTNGTLIQRKLMFPYDNHINDLDVDDAGNIYVASQDNVVFKTDTNLNIVWFAGLSGASGRSIAVQGTTFSHRFVPLGEIDYELIFFVGGVAEWGADFIVNDTIVATKTFNNDINFYIPVSDIGFVANVTANITYNYGGANFTELYNFTTPEQPEIPLPIVTPNALKIIDNVPRFSVSVRRFATSFSTFPAYLFDFETNEFDCIMTSEGEYCGVLDNVYVVINDVEFPLQILYRPESQVERVGSATIYPAYTGDVYSSRYELINQSEWSGETIFYLGNVAEIDVPTGTYEYFYRAYVYDTTTEEFFVAESEVLEFSIVIPRAEWKSYFEPVKNVPKHLGSDNWTTGFRTLVVIVSLLFIVFLLYVFTSNNGIEMLFLPLIFIAVTLLLIYFTISGVIPFWVFLLIILIGGFILFKRFSS